MRPSSLGMSKFDIYWTVRPSRGCGNQYLWIAFGIHTTQSKHYQTSYSSDFFHHHHHWINGIKIEPPNIVVLLPLQILAHHHQRRTPPLSNGNGQEIDRIPRSGDKLDICFPQLPHTFTPSSSSVLLVIHTVWIIHSVNAMLWDDAHLGYKLMSCRFWASTNVPFT